MFVAIDDSESMAKNGASRLALEALTTLCRALTILGKMIGWPLILCLSGRYDSTVSAQVVLYVVVIRFCKGFVIIRHILLIHA